MAIMIRAVSCCSGSRHKVLGGWIYNCAHTHTIPNEAWWASTPFDLPWVFVLTMTLLISICLRLWSHLPMWRTVLSVYAITSTTWATFCLLEQSEWCHLRRSAANRTMGLMQLHPGSIFLSLGSLLLTWCQPRSLHT